MQLMGRGSRLTSALSRQLGGNAAAVPQLQQPSEAVQRRLLSSQVTGKHGEGTSRGEAGARNFWEAPTEPSQWTANQGAGDRIHESVSGHLQRGFAVLGVAGVGCYALLSGWLRAKEADLPELQKEAKPDAPPAVDPTDRRHPQVSDAVTAAFPIKESLRAASDAPTASPKLSENRQYGQAFSGETGVQGRKDNHE